jgi:hypothetical protein
MLTTTTQNPFPSPSEVGSFAQKQREQGIQGSLYWLRTRFNYNLDRRRNNEQGVSMYVGTGEEHAVDVFEGLLREKGWETSYKDKHLQVTAVVTVVAREEEGEAPRDLFNQIIPTPQEAMNRLASRLAEVDKQALKSLIDRVKDKLADSPTVGANVPLYGGDETYVATEVVALLEEMGWKAKIRGETMQVRVRKEKGRRWWQC